MRFMLSRKQTLALEEAGAGGRRCCQSTGGRCHHIEDGGPCFWLNGDAQMALWLRLREFRHRLRSPSGHLSRRGHGPYRRRPGRHRASHIDELIEDLYEIYHAEGGSHRVTFDPYTERYSGPFLEFVRVAFGFCKVDATDGAIQKRINRVVKSRLLWD